MTDATTSMSLFIRAQAPLSSVESATLQTTSPSADAEACRIAAAVARGDEAAFRQLYDIYRGRLLRFALVLARGDESIAQDAVQFTFITAAKRLRRIKSGEHLWNWLARIARQHISKAWRQQKKDCPLVAVSELPDRADEVVPESLLEQSLDAALPDMGSEERQLIESFYFDRLSHKEMAAQLGITPKAVSSRLERAREKLRSLVARKLSHET